MVYENKKIGIALSFWPLLSLTHVVAWPVLRTVKTMSLFRYFLVGIYNTGKDTINPLPTTCAYLENIGTGTQCNGDKI